MSRILHRARKPLQGRTVVPGDKSISHRVALLGLIAPGRCRATGWLEAADTLSSLEAVRRLGARADLHDGVLSLEPAAGRPVAGDTVRSVVLDCGNSGTTTRLLLGLLSGWLDPSGPSVELTGDASLSTRPMGRIVDPLRSMGAELTYLDHEGRLPIRIQGSCLTGIDYHLPVPSAQVKSALLLAGLFARGRTRVTGGGASRDHTERMLRMMGAPVMGDPDPAIYNPGENLLKRGLDLHVPADPSAAAFLQVAAALVPGSALTVTGQSLNPGRTGVLDVFSRCGLDLNTIPCGGSVAAAGTEPCGDVTVKFGPVKPFTITAGDVPGLVDELPVLAVLATQARGESLVTGAADLRHKESDRIAMMARTLQSLGADIEERPDGWRIVGPTPLRGGDEDPLVLPTAGDHRIAMALAVAGLIAEGRLALDDDACVAISFPDFFEKLGILAGIAT